MTATLINTINDLEEASASEVIAWAKKTYSDKLVLASSFQDCVLIDLVINIAPDIEVVFINTGMHFQETIEYVETIRSQYDLRLVTLQVDECASDFPCGIDGCCNVRKVIPFDRFLEKNGTRAWISGIKRVDTDERADVPVVGWDERRGLVKINPIATWSEENVSGYKELKNLIEHPLASKGYGSIGCAPTTRPINPGENPRAGRWSGQDKTECGLHLP
ncbi:MAG: phosphoadenylyl-sulfate reductase [Acidimicrobiales bacterium]|nr:phosphoadenylyl-sulfate reductase [Acidimicrobiales bacterium]